LTPERESQTAILSALRVTLKNNCLDRQAVTSGFAVTVDTLDVD
jgi:hypothetical protein